MGKFFSALNSKVIMDGYVRFVRYCMSVLATCKFSDKHITIKGRYRVHILSGAQGRVTPKFIVVSGQNLNFDFMLILVTCKFDEDLIKN